MLAYELNIFCVICICVCVGLRCEDRADIAEEGVCPSQSHRSLLARDNSELIEALIVRV